MNFDKFDYISMTGDCPIDSDQAMPFMIQAAELSEMTHKIIHIQNTAGYTIHIIYPEDRTAN